MSKFVLSPKLKVYGAEGRRDALAQLKEVIERDYPQIQIQGIGQTGMSVNAEQMDIAALQEKFSGFYMEAAVQFHIPRPPFIPGLG